MFFKRCLFRFTFIVCFLFVSTYLIFYSLKPLFESSSVIIPYSLHPYDICVTNPHLWKTLKSLFWLVHILCNFIYSYSICSFILNLLPFFTKSKPSKNKSNCSIVPFSSLSLLVGKNLSNQPIFIPEKSLYQNILITGTIGTGKTSSCMYPFTRQLISYNSQNLDSKIGMLILDVKGNFYKEVINFSNFSNRLSDLYIIELGGDIRYNPLDKPNLKPAVLSNRLKTILTLFSPNNSESFWLDKVEQTLTEAIKYCRLYNNGYVTFLELHKLINNSDYFFSQLITLKERFLSGHFSKQECYDAISSIDFFQNELFSLDDRTFSIIKSEITRITSCFVSDYDVLHTFCPEKNEINFLGFEDLIHQGTIVVLNMNVSQYRNLAKIIATYLKLDFQTAVLNSLTSSSSHRPVAFICDEYHEYCTLQDADFFAQSREAKCINIVATQSYSSLLHSLNNESSVKVIIQNLINKFWFRTDDFFTIQDVQNQIGKEDKRKLCTTLSENAKETHYDYLTHSFLSHHSNLSETLNESIYHDYIYDSNFFTQELRTFHCLAFLSNGYEILSPMQLSLIPYFLEKF